MHGTRSGVVGAVDQALQPSVYHCSRAHGTRLNCNKQFAVSQTVVTNGSTGFSQGDDLGVRGGIGVVEITVPAPADDLALAHHDSAHRHLSGVQGALGGTQGLLHHQFVGIGHDHALYRVGRVWGQVGGADRSAACTK